MSGDDKDKCDKAGIAAGSELTSGADSHMRRDEFEIGGTFWWSGHKWRCADIAQPNHYGNQARPR